MGKFFYDGMGIKRNILPLTLNKKKIIALSLLGLIVISASIGALRYMNGGKIALHNDKQKAEILIPTGASFDDVCTILDVVADYDKTKFNTLSAIMKYSEYIHAGRYEITNGMTIRSLIQLLRSGNQKPVNVTFNNVRTLPQLAGIASRHLEADSVELLAAMADSALVTSLGYNKETFPVIFIPDTYQFMWNTSAEQWVKRMKHEYDKFWTDERKHKADSIGLTITEVSILASIVEEETNRKDEYPIIAGLYLNRLRKGMLLQACPTLKYSLGDFSLRRILAKDKNVESPYNTYKYLGLPPGPIRLPMSTTIDAVLNAADTEYLFMCAKPDGSGGHNFARTNAEHSRNAANYQKELNRRKIYR
ncbi:MAG: endolytic transglycosylase MltG [Bacteroidales bacterium]|nr:endolytic transglycosylase MltG [Bacteroidales bacterium]